MSIPPAVQRFRNIIIVGLYLAFAAVTYAIVMQGVTPMGVSFSAAGGSGLYDTLVLWPTDADGPWNRWRFDTGATISEIGCTIQAEITRGEADSPTSNDTLTDATQDFDTMDLDAGDIIWNETDGSLCTYASNTPTTVTCASALTGGSNDQFAQDDKYSIHHDAVEVTLDLYQTDANGRRDPTALGETVTCDLGEVVNSSPGGSLTITGDRSVGFDLEVTGSENPETLHIWFIAN